MMTMNAKTVAILLAGVSFLPSLSAQTAPLTLTGAATLGPFPNSLYNFTGSGTGTLTPGGASQIKIDAYGPGDDDCNNNLEIILTVTAANGDKLALRAFIPQASGTSDASGARSLSGTFVVTGGTGQYAGKGGSGTITLLLTSPPPNIAVTMSLTGSITGQYTPTASITPSGIVPVGHSRVMVQSGSWVSVYGTNLANTTAVWAGDFPTTLGGVTAKVNGKSAYFWFVSPGQINMQLPDDTVRGCVTVSLTTPNGPTSAQVQVNASAPSLSLLDTKYPAAVILTPNGGGAYGGGTYDLAGPVGRFSYSTRPVKKGESLVLYGVGFGPTNPAVPAGAAFSGAAPTTLAAGVQVSLNNQPIQPSFVGQVSAGLYQINLTVPGNLPVGDIPLRVLTSNGQSQTSIFISVQ